jgi:hypothetical protein
MQIHGLNQNGDAESANISEELGGIRKHGHGRRVNRASWISAALVSFRTSGASA